VKSYEEFKAAIRNRESSGNYGVSPLKAVNPFDYLGAYQMGMPRLCDLGLARRKPGKRGMDNACFEFIPPLTRAEFLKNKHLQDRIFDQHVADLKRRLLLVYKGANLSGAIAACHLVGYQAFLDYLRYGKDKSDGFGTPLTQYYEKFRGYEIP
jgi:hypothetical protein